MICLDDEKEEELISVEAIEEISNEATLISGESLTNVDILEQMLKAERTISDTIKNFTYKYFSSLVR